MNYLAIDTSSKYLTVIACREGTESVVFASDCALQHSVRLMDAIENAMAQANLGVSDCDFFCAVTGPGSFTGIRIGVSTAKGLAWGAQKPAIGVSTLEAMAYHGIAAGEGALVCAAMDARRSQIYNALFEIRDGKPRRLCQDRAISLAELGAELKKMQKSVFLVGDGAQLCYNTCLDMGIPAVLAPGNLVVQSAWGVAMAAFGQTPAPAEELLPVYLRLSQAERERQARLAAEAEKD